MRVFVLLMISLIASSCSGGRKGYFVALWPPEGSSISSGEIADVISQSEMRNVYVIEKKDDKKREEVSKTSGKFFKKRKEAKNFSEKFAPYVNQFGYSEKSLIIRTSPGVSSEREYRLRPSQVVKIIEKLPGPVTVEKLSGYWYQVLTDDGFEGYCFDRDLIVYELDSAKSGSEKKKDFIGNFLDHAWYPTAYLETLKSGRVIIEKLRTGEGIFADKDEKKIIIQTAEERIEYSYENAVSSSDGSVILSGTPVEIVFYPGDRIYVKYSHKGVDYSGFYTQLEKPVDYYIDAELKRRMGEVDSFLKRGRYLASDLYGSITFQDQGRFMWTGYINLVPEIIPFGYGNSGYVKNDYFLSETLAEDFDGVFSFVFDRNGKEIIFAWFFTEGGVQLTHVPEESVEDGIIYSIPDEKYMYYFRQSSLLDEE